MILSNIYNKILFYISTLNVSFLSLVRSGHEEQIKNFREIKILFGSSNFIMSITSSWFLFHCTDCCTWRIISYLNKFYKFPSLANGFSFGSQLQGNGRHKNLQLPGLWHGGYENLHCIWYLRKDGVSCTNAHSYWGAAGEWFVYNYWWLILRIHDK